jgi:hypothetical protein
MKRFEYQITTHSAEFFKELVYFCSEDGNCAMEQIPSDQIDKLEGLLNEQGASGWELAQASFGKGGLMIFWKKSFAPRDADGSGESTL